ncbi:aminoglycoside phosphotransferase family protein [Streptomyces sp. NPDC048111]|uniref:aminoglycoside phosphotransferase family protein n=1 Tax=Streptomyces sp. NPDC048111 TaxID=3365500 RepID=UPI00371B6B18
MTADAPRHRVRVPDALLASFDDEAGRAWLAALPALAESYLDWWDLRLDGPPAHGTVALVLPVARPDGSRAVLKLQPVDEETRGEPLALRAWAGRDAVRLLDSDPATGTMLLERLDASRSLAGVADGTVALRILSELLARLVALPAPAGLPTLADTAAAMLDRLPHLLSRLEVPADRPLLTTCADAMREVLPEPGDRLLHWDLHYENVLARGSCAGSAGPTQWLAIDPKPLAGHPGFELLPALRNRWDDIVATGNAARAVGHRFRLMTEVVGLDRQQATGWTLGRVLQNALWDIEDGAATLDPQQATIARALLGIG